MGRLLADTAMSACASCDVALFAGNVHFVHLLPFLLNVWGVASRVLEPLESHAVSMQAHAVVLCVFGFQVVT